MGDFLNNVIRNEGILTRSGIIESFYTPPFMTGLIIEVSSGDYSNDKEKSQKFGDLNLLELFLYIKLKLIKNKMKQLKI